MTQSDALHSLFLREMFLQNRDDTDEVSLVGGAGTGKETGAMTTNTIGKLVVLARTVDAGDSGRDPATITTEEATMTVSMSI